MLFVANNNILIVKLADFPRAGAWLSPSNNRGAERLDESQLSELCRQLC